MRMQFFLNINKVFCCSFGRGSVFLSCVFWRTQRERIRQFRPPTFVSIKRHRLLCSRRLRRSPRKRVRVLSGPLRMRQRQMRRARACVRLSRRLRRRKRRKAVRSWFQMQHRIAGQPLCAPATPDQGRRCSVQWRFRSLPQQRVIFVPQVFRQQWRHQDDSGK